MVLHTRHTLWTGISETTVNVITSATRTHVLIKNPAVQTAQQCAEYREYAIGMGKTHIGANV